MHLAWISLVIAGLLETGWATALKASHGFSRLIPLLITIVLILGSFSLLTYSMKSLPLGTAYAVWTGMASVGTAIIGIVFFDEVLSFSRILCIALIISGIVGLKLIG